MSDGSDSTHRAWRAARSYLNAHRYDLTQSAQDLYPPSLRVSGTPLLARPDWVASRPIPLDDVRLSWRDDPAEAGITGREQESVGIRSLREDGRPFPSYSDALGALDRPRLFENRRCYRLRFLSISGVGAELAFGSGSYFDIINICEAAAHEYAAADLAEGGKVAPTVDKLPFRSMLGDPTDLTRRPVIPAISTLTLRAGPAPGDVEMILHWRDPAKVASGGGLYQVAPVGVFQPSSDATWNTTNDFDLFRAISREMSEELLGTDEDYQSDTQPIDYERWPFHNQLVAARRNGALRIYWLGLGIDPLTLVADMLTVAVFDSDVFDRTFPALATTNAEGRILERPAAHERVGFSFDSETVNRFTTREQMQPAGAALLRIAWDRRDELLLD